MQESSRITHLHHKERSLSQVVKPCVAIIRVPHGRGAELALLLRAGVALVLDRRRLPWLGDVTAQPGRVGLRPVGSPGTCRVLCYITKQCQVT